MCSSSTLYLACFRSDYFRVSASRYLTIRQDHQLTNSYSPQKKTRLPLLTVVKLPQNQPQTWQQHPRNQPDPNHRDGIDPWYGHCYVDMRNGRLRSSLERILLNICRKPVKMVGSFDFLFINLNSLDIALVSTIF